MKKIITTFIFCFLCGECFSQAGEWVWIKGDSVPNQPGNFGVQGVPSPTNNPPSLYEPCEWTDLNGNFWLFGGWTGTGIYCDIWKFDSNTNEWTWMKGSGTMNQSPIFGTQGIPSPLNNPGFLEWCTASWVDQQGDFWMFGGGGGVCYNALWKYIVATNEWVWMKGSNLTNPIGVYGIQGIPDPLNNPAPRWETSATWVDAAGDLWLFGGFTAGSACLNDLWRYSIASNTWTWMKGSASVNQLGVYGTLGIEDTLNTPASRMVYSHWKDSLGRFWLFGGRRNISNTYFNDLWSFNINTNNWTWMGGSNLGNAPGSYGTKCTPSIINIPGARFENRAAWTDQDRNFWFFGGMKSGGGSFNDLWKYCFGAGQWVWISGNNFLNPSGNWGIPGVSSPANRPDSRSGAVGWTDNNGHLYFFGGSTAPFGYFHNDLWKYTIDTTCGVCPAPNSIEENNLTNELLVFPNPTNSSLTISFQSSSNQTIELRLYNTLGKQIYIEKEEITKGKFEKEINVEKLGEGIYFLQLKTKDGNINRKVIVSHR